MSVLRASALPNVLTVARVITAPVVFLLILVPGFTSRIIAFFLFVAAGLSDLWDGHLARKHGWISPFGQFFDPIADKLLLVATFVPFYIISHETGPVGRIPWWGALPLWILLLVFGREVLITVLRSIAARRGRILPAGRAGKRKAVFQNIFIGSVLLWYALQSAALQHDWRGATWAAWQVFHAIVLNVSLAIAVTLTLYSLVVYLRSWRSLNTEATP